MCDISENTFKKIHCYFFEREGTFYLYDYCLGIIVELTDFLYYDLCEFVSGGELSEEREKRLRELIDSGLILGDNFAVQEKDDFAYLSFAPIYKCNFRCKYCFGNHGDKYTGTPKEFTEEALYSMLDFFFNKAFPNAKRYRIDLVSGGEPLLGFDTIKKTVNYIESCESIIYNKKVDLWMCTNGSMLSDEICEYLDKHNISIGISIDGEKDVHDKNRIDINGNGTYDTIVSRIREIINRQNLTKKFKNIWGLTVASDENSSFVKIINHHKNIGLKSVQIKLVRSSESLNVEDVIKGYAELSAFLYKKYITAEYDYMFMILNDNDQFGKVFKRVLLNQTVIRRCCAGVNKITVCPNGAIYPCDSFVGIEDFELGNIQCGIKSSQFANLNVYEREKCNKCLLKFLCGGDCYYNSYINGGNIFNPPEAFCEIQKFIIEESIILRYKMEMYNEKVFQKFIRRLELKDDY